MVELSLPEAGGSGSTDGSSNRTVCSSLPILCFKSSFSDVAISACSFNILTVCFKSSIRDGSISAIMIVFFLSSILNEHSQLVGNKSKTSNLVRVMLWTKVIHTHRNFNLLKITDLHKFIWIFNHDCNQFYNQWSFFLLGTLEKCTRPGLLCIQWHNTVSSKSVCTGFQNVSD